MPHIRHENVRHATLLFRAEGDESCNQPTRKKRGWYKMDVSRLSDAALKELYDTMAKRKGSCAQNPQEESVYETQSEDWQRLFKILENEMRRRGFI